MYHQQLRNALLLVLGGVVLAGGARADDWPQFRGPNRDNISGETGLLRAWPEAGPQVLWSTPMCQGYSSAAIHSGRVYVNDYEEEAKTWFVRCLELASGKELWRFSEQRKIRPNHGITRSVPVVDGRFVVAVDPKCVVHGLEAATGKEVWRKDLVETYGAKIPPWYNGQCPLQDGEQVIIGVGGEALLVCLDKATGNEVWRTPNTEKWPLSHASVMTAELGGVKQYLWCTLFGPVGVRASDGALLWHHDRKFNVAVAPSPLAIGSDRVFMTSGYEAGSIMLRVGKEGERFTTEALFDWSGDEWNAEVHTPILYENRLLAVGKKKRGLLTCFDTDGKRLWDSDEQASFELGSFLLADGMLFILEGQTGMLRLLDAKANAYRELAHAQVLSGHDVWGPMALADGKLVLRDMEKMVCIQVGGETKGSAGRAVDDRFAAAVRESPFRLVAFAEVGQSAGAPKSATGDKLPLHYEQCGVLSGKGSEAGQFSETLRGLTCDAQGRLYAVGDAKVVVFGAAGEVQKTWSTGRQGYCVGVGPDGTVYVGEAGQVELFDSQGTRRATWQDVNRFGMVTAIGFAGDEILIADVVERCIRRLDHDGKVINTIGKKDIGRGFMLPNRHLDLIVDRDGMVRAPNPGQHRVLQLTLDGKLQGHFGRFDGRDPAGFTGCCNPTNLALTPDGNIVTAEKAPPRVKVYNPDGKLLAVFGTDDFDANCSNMDVAVDGRGRIYVADTERLQILVYAAVAAGSQPTQQEARP